MTASAVLSNFFLECREIIQLLGSFLVVFWCISEYLGREHRKCDAHVFLMVLDTDITKGLKGLPANNGADF